MPVRHIAALLAVGVSAQAIAQETTTYTYDALGRVTRTAHTGTSNPGLANDYTYDQADNRTARLTSGSSVTPTVPDWSFELPNVGNYLAYNPTATGVTFSSASGVAGNGSPFGFATAPDGNQVGFVQSATGNTGSTALSVSNLQTGRAYVIAFRGTFRPGYPANPLTLKYNSTTLNTVTPSSSSSFLSYISNSFVAAATTGTISFTGATITGDQASAIDGVQLIAFPNVSDYSFEAPNQGGYFSYQPLIQGVSFGPNTGITSNGAPFNFTAAPDGVQVAFLQSLAAGTTGISVAVADTVPGRNYTVTFRLAQRIGSPVAVPVTVLYNGVSLGTWTPASSAFQVVTTTFQATGVNGTLRFTVPQNSGGPSSGIDFIQVAPAP